MRLCALCHQEIRALRKGLLWSAFRALMGHAPEAMLFDALFNADQTPASIRWLEAVAIPAAKAALREARPWPTN